MSTFVYEDVLNFIRFLQIRDPSSDMYKAGLKFVEVLKMTKTLKNAEQEAIENAAEVMEEEQAIAADDEIGVSANQLARGQSQLTFCIDDFKEMLNEGNE